MLVQSNKIESALESCMGMVMGLDFMKDTAIIAGMGTAFMVVCWQR